MCVIIYSEKGLKNISEETIENAWETNPDGAGLLLLRDNKAFVKKGFMELEEFKSYLKTLPKNVPIALHFRIKTHGEIVPELTHPFIISNKEEEILSLEAETKKPILIHNGTLNIDPIDKHHSDTSSLAYLLSVVDKEHWDNIIKMVKNGSRLLLYSDGKIKLYGDWKEYKGLKVSNLLFTYKSSYGYYGYGCDYGYGYGYGYTTKKKKKKKKKSNSKTTSKVSSKAIETKIETKEVINTEVETDTFLTELEDLSQLHFGELKVISEEEYKKERLIRGVENELEIGAFKVIEYPFTLFLYDILKEEYFQVDFFSHFDKQRFLDDLKYA